MPDSLRGRLAALFATVLALVLIAYSGAVYLLAVVEPDEQEDAAGQAEAEAARQGLLFALLVTLPFAVVVGAGGALWLTLRGLRPDDVIELADRLGVDQLDLRVPVSTRDPIELRRLAAATNAMLVRLERSVAGLSRFTADAAHELRTPLTRIVTRLETTLRHPRDADALRVALADALDDARALARLTDALLALSRADAGEAVGSGAADVSAVVSDLEDAFAADFAAAGVSFDVDIAADVGAVAGEALWLTRALGNLIDNARKFTPSGGRVRLTAHAVGPLVVIAVEDSGRGIAADERDRVFERFFRSTAVRGRVEGFGLGLSLARDVARACGGDIVVDGSFVGGARLVLTLPRRMAAP